MSTSSPSHLRDLERAYTRLVIETLPRIQYIDYPDSVYRDAHANLMIVGLDDQLDACIASVPRTQGVREAEASQRLRDITESVVRDFEDRELITLDPERGLLKALVSALHEVHRRAHMIFDDDYLAAVVPEFSLEVQHAVEGSVFYEKVAARVRGPKDNHRCVCLESYLTKTKFASTCAATRSTVFHSLLSEVANATWHTHRVDENLLSKISAVVLPFSALGILRGAAVWFCTGEPQKEHVASTVDTACIQTGLVEILGNLYSAAVIDVFEAFLLSEIEKSSLPKAGGFGGLPLGPFKYLYPCHSAEFIQTEEDPGGYPEGEVVGLLFRDPDVRKYIGAAGIRWHLLYDRRTCDLCPSSTSKALMRRAAFAQLIEAKLRHVPMSASTIAGNEVSAGVYRLGHQLSGRVKPSIRHLQTVTNRIGRLTEEGHSPQLNPDVHEAIIGIQAALERVHGLGQLMDIIADAFVSREGARIFTQEPSWSSEEPYAVREKLETLVSCEPDDARCAPLRLDFAGAEEISELAIHQWLDAEDRGTVRRVRPCDVLYDETLHEILANAAAHGQRSDGIVTIGVSVETVYHEASEHQCFCLVFQNNVDKTSSEELSDLADRLCVPGLEKWYRCGESGHRPRGGLHFVDLVMAVTGAGMVFMKVSGTPPMVAVALHLEGLRST